MNLEEYKQYLIERQEYICLVCADDFLEDGEPCLTSFPIWDVRICPKCKTVHYVLWDKTLCTEKDYNETIYKQYEGIVPW